VPSFINFCLTPRLSWRVSSNLVCCVTLHFALFHHVTSKCLWGHASYNQLKMDNFYRKRGGSIEFKGHVYRNSVFLREYVSVNGSQDVELFWVCAKLSGTPAG
jgi:hypothetical protein